MGGTIGWHSGQTRLEWSWSPPNGTTLSGHFTYPDSYKPAEARANNLLRETEATFVERCPPLSLPLEVLNFSGELQAETRKRIDALREWRPPASCQASGAGR